MIKRLILIAIFTLNFLSAPAIADDQVLDLITAEAIEELDIDLPEDLPQGYHSAVVQLTDPDTGITSDEEISFCKDTADEIHWDNNCPDLEATTASQEQPILEIVQETINGQVVDVVVNPELLEGITDPEKLPDYNPISEPDKAADTQVAGFAAVSVLSAGGAAAASAAGGSSGGSGSSGGGGSSGGSGGSDGPGKGSSSSNRAVARREDQGPESTEEALHSAQTKQNEENATDVIDSVAMGYGDRSITWKAPFTDRIDSAFVATSIAASRFAPLLGKIFIDAAYLRVILGSISLLTIPAAAILGFQALATSDFQPIPPVWQVFAAIAVLSLLDSFAGLVAVLIYAVGVFVSGNASSLQAVLTVLTVSAICVSPAIMASSFRPFRRKVRSGQGIWERVVDYLLASVLTAWTISGFINALNSISGKQLAILGYSTKIGVIVGAAIFTRMALEDLATYLYPRRSAIFAIDLPKPSKLQQYLSLTARALIFALIMNRFVGVNIPLLIGTILFILPNFAKLSLGNSLPKSRILNLALPKGGLRIVVMTLLGTAVAKFSETLFTNPQSFLTWGFVLLSIPGFILSLLALLADDKKSAGFGSHKVGKWVYRAAGILIFYLILQIAQGKDLLELLNL